MRSGSIGPPRRVVHIDTPCQIFRRVFLFSRRGKCTKNILLCIEYIIAFFVIRYLCGKINKCLRQDIGGGKRKGLWQRKANRMAEKPGQTR